MFAWHDDDGWPYGSVPHRTTITFRPKHAVIYLEVPAMNVVEETPDRVRVERQGAMRVPGVVFISRRLLPDPQRDKSLQQVVNVATLPGIVEASYAMPDMHWGYGSRSWGRGHRR